MATAPAIPAGTGAPSCCSSSPARGRSPGLAWPTPSCWGNASRPGSCLPTIPPTGPRPVPPSSPTRAWPVPTPRRSSPAPAWNSPCSARPATTRRPPVLPQLAAAAHRGDHLDAQAPARPGTPRRPCPRRAVVPDRPAAPGAQRRHLAQLADRRAGQAFPDRLRPLMTCPYFPVNDLGNGERGLPPPGGVLQLDAVHPLHPPEPPPAGGDQPDREPVPGRQRRPADAGGEQQPVEVADGEADPVAAGRTDQQALRVAAAAHQRRHGRANPVLLGVPASRAVQDRADARVERREVRERQLALAVAVGDDQAPRGRVD